MENPPRRSGVTELSDDELFLLDFFFDKPATGHLVRREKYSAHMNVCYSHGLDDRQLQDTLKSLCQRKLLARRVNTGGYFGGDCIYELSPSGGALWELERQPIWDCYCEIRQKPLRLNDWNGAQLLTVLSPSLQTVQDYVEKALATGSSKALESPPKSRSRLIHDPRLEVYWKEFSEVHAILLKVLPDYFSMDRGADEEFDDELWEHYRAAQDRLEDLRTWWGTIGELDSLRR